MRWTLITLSSPIKNKYFHEWFSQPIVSNPEISSCSDTNLADMSNICFNVRSFVFGDGMTSVHVILSHENCWFQCYRHAFHHIIECFSSFSVTFIEDRFCLFRTWSFTLHKNDLDSTDNSNSVSSFPMINCCGLAPLWGITTCCSVLSRGFCLVHNGLRCSIVLGVLMKETWLGLVCLSPRGHNGLPRSITHRFVSLHSWEDQALLSSHLE